MAAPQSFSQRVELAEKTRGLFMAEAGRVLLELGAEVQARLTALMNETATSREMQSRRDAWLLYQKVQPAWLDGTRRAWQAALRPAGGKASGLRLDEVGAGLELVGTDEVENKILASRLVLAVLEKVGAQLDDLRLRIRFLEDRDDLAAHDILRPEVLLLPLVAQWSSNGLPREAWPWVSEGVQRLLAERLQAAYTRCNQFLIEQGVMPTIELKDRIRRTTVATIAPDPAGLAQPVRPAGGPGGRQGAGLAAGGLAGAAVNAGVPAAAGSGMAAGLPQPRRSTGLFGGRLGWEGEGAASSASVEGLPAYGGPQDETRLMTQDTPLARARSRAQGVMGQLRRLLAGPGGAGFEATASQGPSPALAAAIAPGADRAGASIDLLLEDGYSPAGVARVAGALREQSSELKKKAATRSEKATIEIVALMFQSILTEERIPSAIRVWFARLQMPVLRVALAEPEFFGSLNHPARQLIDRMGSCVMGFDAGDVNGQALEAEIRRIVQVIEQYPETGRQVFEVVYGEFQQFLTRFLTGKDATQKVVSVAQQVEQKETLTIQYTIEMRKLLKDMPVRDEIRSFLFKVWAEVLAVAAVRQGLQHADTVTLRKTAADLVWAAGAKPQRSERTRVIQDLPQLLQRLRTGMNLLGLPAATQEAHIKTVSDTLADAFLAKTQPIAPAQIEALAQRLAELEFAVSDEGLGELPLDAESIELLLGVEASALEVVANGGSKPTPAMLAWAQELQPGAWFTLDHNGRIARVQFVWRSERKQLNLLASTDGRSYLIQAGRLAAYLQAGLLLPQEEESLTVRATRDALNKLEANPERLLG
ncbi:MAG: hypothetical protein A2Z93_11720 [Curvibacter sp. GWA2_64_110]|nr:MAG: hypothetical protein A2Z93_11720 [Curvibacter sp. GWA2_64_110]HCY16063.1 DUF1631 domain-containing protein [Curvibacter sp.]